MNAYETNMMAAHEALSTAKAMLYAAAQQTDSHDELVKVERLADDTADAVHAISYLRFSNR